MSKLKGINTTMDSQFIVYYSSKDKPDTAWEYIHNPPAEVITDILGNITSENSKPYARLYGYWEETIDSNGKDTSYTFIEHTSNNIKKISLDYLIDNIIPNPDLTIIFDSVEDFILDKI